MEHIKTIFTGNLQAENTKHNPMGCGECQTSCQSACKTSCTVANQSCEKEKGTSTLRRPMNGNLVNAAKPVSA